MLAPEAEVVVSVPDPELARRSTVPKEALDRLWRYLVEGGIEFARHNGARLVEACPIDLSRDSRSIGLFVGSSRVFEKAGFERLVERKSGRPLMRLVL